MPLTPHAINMLSTADPGRLDKCNVTDVYHEFPQAKHWVSHLGMMVVFNSHLSPENRPLVLRYLRRVEMALWEYSLFKTELCDHISGPPRWAPYYRALHHAEMAANLLYQAHDVMSKALSLSIFQKADGSPMQRLNLIYNQSKHLVPDVKEKVWITNVGIQTDDALLTYPELEELLRAAARMAERMLQPSGEAG